MTMQGNVPPWKDLVIIVVIVGSFVALTPLNIILFECIASNLGTEMDYWINAIMLACILVQVTMITVPLWRRLTSNKNNPRACK